MLQCVPTAGASRFDWLVSKLLPRNESAGPALLTSPSTRIFAVLGTGSLLVVPLAAKAGTIADQLPSLGLVGWLLIGWVVFSLPIALLIGRAMTRMNPGRRTASSVAPGDSSVAREPEEAGAIPTAARSRSGPGAKPRGTKAARPTRAGVLP